MSQGLIWHLLHWPEAGRDQSRQGGEGQDSGTRDLRASVPRYATLTERLGRGHRLLSP